MRPVNHRRVLLACADLELYPFLLRGLDRRDRAFFPECRKPACPGESAVLRHETSGSIPGLSGSRCHVSLGRSLLSLKAALPCAPVLAALLVANAVGRSKLARSERRRPLILGTTSSGSRPGRC